MLESKTQLAMPFLSIQGCRADPDDGEDFDPDSVPRAVVGVGADLVTEGVELGVHRHRKAQLLLTLRGVVTCEADQGVWIVPPHCAVWIPGDLPHTITVAGNVEMYCLFVEPEAAPTLPRNCSTLSISPLLQHLLQQVSQMSVLYDVDGADGRLVAVLLDQIAAAPTENLSFPMPANAKLRKIAAAMMADPADRPTIGEWGRRVGVAERTAVQTVALNLGYEGASAFVTMFRKALGKLPGRYLAERNIKA